MPLHRTLILSAALLATTALNAQPTLAGQDPYESMLPISVRNDPSFDISTGYRQDSLDWNIASDLNGTTTPNILSELTWENISIYEVKAAAEYTMPLGNNIGKGGGIYMDASIAMGWILAGDNQDSDYNGNDRTLEFSRSNNNAGGGRTNDLLFTLGYEFVIGKESKAFSRRNRARELQKGAYYTITPIMGFSRKAQNFEITDGFQTIPATGAFAGLDSRYETEWTSPFVGTKLGIETGKHLLKFRGEYHFLGDYEGKGYWNLRTDFRQDPSFTQTGDATGMRLNTEYAYKVAPNTAVTLNASYWESSVENGTDTTFFTNGAVSSIRLNEVNSESYGLHLGLKKTW